MKTKTLVIALLFSTFLFSQSKFSIGFGINEQFIKKDRGVNYEGFIGYKVNQDIAINLVGSNAEMKNKDLDINYKLDKYSILMNYDFAKSENSKLESIFGFSYLKFDKKLLEKNNTGLGIDVGVQTTFGLKNNLNYGLKLVSTYSNISPGGIFNAGAFLKYNL
jgi:hypothetical protein